MGLADDHPVVLRGVEQLLNGSPYVVAWQATSRSTCVQACRSDIPDILILDLRLGADLAPDVVRDLAMFALAPKVVVLTGHDDRPLINACIDAGVSGVLFKDTNEMNIVESLARVQDGELVLDPRLAQSREQAAKRAAELGVTALTTREHDVLRLVARGMTSRDVALELSLSVNTVRSYVQSMLLKLGAHTRIEAVTTAQHLRLL